MADPKPGVLFTMPVALGGLGRVHLPGDMLAFMAAALGAPPKPPPDPPKPPDPPMPPDPRDPAKLIAHVPLAAAWNAGGAQNLVIGMDQDGYVRPLEHALQPTIAFDASSTRLSPTFGRSTSQDSTRIRIDARSPQLSEISAPDRRSNRLSLPASTQVVDGSNATQSLVPAPTNRESAYDTAISLAQLPLVTQFKSPASSPSTPAFDSIVDSGAIDAQGGPIGGAGPRLVTFGTTIHVRPGFPAIVGTDDHRTASGPEVGGWIYAKPGDEGDDPCGELEWIAWSVIWFPYTMDGVENAVLTYMAIEHWTHCDKVKFGGVTLLPERNPDGTMAFEPNRSFPPVEQKGETVERKMLKGRVVLWGDGRGGGMDTVAPHIGYEGSAKSSVLKRGPSLMVFVPDCKHLQVAQIHRTGSKKKVCGADGLKENDDIEKMPWTEDGDVKGGPPDIIEVDTPTGKGKVWMDSPGTSDVVRQSRSENLELYHWREQFITWVCCDGVLLDFFEWEWHFELEFECRNGKSGKITKNTSGSSVGEVADPDGAKKRFEEIWERSPQDLCDRKGKQKR